MHGLVSYTFSEKKIKIRQKKIFERKKFFGLSPYKNEGKTYTQSHLQCRAPQQSEL